MKNMFKAVAFAGAGMLALNAAAFASDSADAKEKLKSWYADVVADFVSCDTSAIGKYNAQGRRGFYPDSAELHDETSEDSMQMAVDFCENGGKHDLTYDIADVVMLKDAALILGSGHYKRTEPDGAISVDSDYTFTEVVVKTSDGWKFKHSHIGAVLTDMGAEDGDSAGE